MKKYNSLNWRIILLLFAGMTTLNSCNHHPARGQDIHHRK